MRFGSEFDRSLRTKCPAISLKIHFRIAPSTLNLWAVHGLLGDAQCVFVQWMVDRVDSVGLCVFSTYLHKHVLSTHHVLVLYVPLHMYVVLYVIFSSSMYG